MFALVAGSRLSIRGTEWSGGSVGGGPHRQRVGQLARGKVHAGQELDLGQARVATRLGRPRVDYLVID